MEKSRQNQWIRIISFIGLVIVMAILLPVIGFSWNSIVLIPVILFLGPVVAMIILSVDQNAHPWLRLSYPIGTMIIYVVVFNWFGMEILYDSSPTTFSKLLLIVMISFPILFVLSIGGVWWLFIRNTNSTKAITTYNTVFTMVFYVFTVVIFVLLIASFMIIG